MSEIKSIDLRGDYLSLRSGGDATPIAGGAEFWKKLGQAGDESGAAVEGNRTVMVFTYSENWNNWEMHPFGDEFVYVLSGTVRLLLAEGESHREVVLAQQTGVVVPRGVWHSAKVDEPAEVLHITPGAGTEHRPA